jgi:hypothetical protein
MSHQFTDHLIIFINPIHLITTLALDVYLSKKQYFKLFNYIVVIPLPVQHDYQSWRTSPRCVLPVQNEMVHYKTASETIAFFQNLFRHRKQQPVSLRNDTLTFF